MSVKQMGEVWELDLPHSEAWVLMALADHADHEGENVFPAVELVAWKTGYDPRSIRRIMASLRAKKIIVPIGLHYSGAVIYRIETSHVSRKKPLVRQSTGKSQKGGDKMSGVTKCQPDSPVTQTVSTITNSRNKSNSTTKVINNPISNRGTITSRETNTFDKPNNSNTKVVVLTTEHPSQGEKEKLVPLDDLHDGLFLQFAEFLRTDGERMLVIERAKRLTKDECRHELRRFGIRGFMERERAGEPAWNPEETAVVRMAV